MIVIIDRSEESVKENSPYNSEFSLSNQKSSELPAGIIVDGFQGARDSAISMLVAIVIISLTRMIDSVPVVAARAGLLTPPFI